MTTEKIAPVEANKAALNHNQIGFYAAILTQLLPPDLRLCSRAGARSLLHGWLQRIPLPGLRRAVPRDYRWMPLAILMVLAYVALMAIQQNQEGV